MAQKNLLTTLQISLKSLIKRMILGAAIGFVIISFFVFSVDEPNPEWGKYWFIRPLIITPLAGAFGILSFYLKDYLQPQKGNIKLLVVLVSTFAFMIALWLGVVLGLDGTMWD